MYEKYKYKGGQELIGIYYNQLNPESSKYINLNLEKYSLSRLATRVLNSVQFLWKV